MCTYRMRAPWSSRINMRRVVWKFSEFSETTRLAYALNSVHNNGHVRTRQRRSIILGLRATSLRSTTAPNSGILIRPVVYIFMLRTRKYAWIYIYYSSARKIKYSSTGSSSFWEKYSYPTAVYSIYVFL